MVKSYIFYRAEKFNLNGYSRDNQISLFEEILTPEELLNREPENIPDETGEIQLRITPTEEVILNNYRAYICNYDLKKNATGKVFGLMFHSYLEPSEFKLYYSDIDKMCIIQTKTDTAISFIKELNTTNEFNLIGETVDFNYIMSKVDEISGAWIAGLKGKHLNSAGLFGVNVHKSPEYIDATSKGELSLIIVKYLNPNDQREYSVGISQKGSIIMYSNFDVFQNEIDFVYRIHKELFK